MSVPYLAKDKYNHAIQVLMPGTNQTVAVGGTSASTTNALDQSTIVIRLVSTVNCFVKIGASPVTATTADTFLPALTPEYFRVDAADALGVKVAVIQQSTSGSLYVTEMD